MVYFLKDDRTENTSPEDKPLKIKWHIAGIGLKAWSYFVIADQYGVRWGLLMATLTWFFFDGVINISVLKRRWYYVGTTDVLDISQQWIAKRLHIDVELLSAILKLSLAILTFTLWRILK